MNKTEDVKKEKPGSLRSTALARAFGLLSIQAMNHPFSVSSTRREVWWLDDHDATNHSLKSIGRCFQDRLNRSVLLSSNSLLLHIRSPMDDNLGRILHQCPGYFQILQVREESQEITLRPQV